MKQECDHLPATLGLVSQSEFMCDQGNLKSVEFVTHLLLMYSFNGVVPVHMVKVFLVMFSR
jgi:hypothetical protein